MEDLKKINAYFEQVYEKHVSEVYKVSLRYVRDELVAEEVTQRVFFEAYIHLKKIDPYCMRAYLIRTARNQSLNWLRSNKRLQKGIIKDVSEQDAQVESLEDYYLRKECQLAIREVAESVLSALLLYNEGWYDAIIMTYYLEYTHDEVAAFMGITKEQLFSRLYRAKKWIQKHHQYKYKKLRKEIWY